MIALGLALAALAAAPDPAARKAETAAAMHSAMHAIVGLQPYLASPVAFRDPANAEVITRSLSALSGVEHRFTVPGKQDPTVETLARVFGAEVARATTEFTQGNTEATRARLKGVTSLCFACHSRERAAKDFDDAAKQVDALGLPPSAKAEFYATTRQFDLALAAWAVAVKAVPKNDSEAFEHAEQMRQYLAVLVRVKDDRAATVAALSAQLARKDLSPFTRRLFSRWLADAKAWNADTFDAKEATATALLEKARALLTDSGAVGTMMGDDDRYLVSLRASGYLHLALEREPNAVWRGEALYLLAVATAVSQDPLLWELDGLYLEACIRQKPHSDIARRCAARMEDRAWLGWTGSGGTRIPPEIRTKLRELRELAQ